MKNKIKLLPCILACALCITPLAACGHGKIYDYQPNTKTEYAEGNKPDDASGTEPPNISAPPQLPQEIGGNEPEPDEQNNAPATVPNPEIAPSVKSVSYIRTKANGLNIRSGPSTAYSSLGTVESGVLLKLDDKIGDFYKTAYLNRTAYVSADPSYTSIVSFDIEDYNDDIERVIDEGLKVLGTKYVYGAARYHYGNGTRVPSFTVTEFDCSSLMQYIFYHGANKLLDMTSRAQSMQGTAVAKSDIKRGDLLFFTNASRKNNTGIERIGHVALYLGQNYILHTASDYAKVEQISSARWGYYISARRIINA